MPFVFDGNWITSIQLDSFTIFQSREGAYTSRDSQGKSSGLLELEFEDDISETPDPLKSQIDTVNYITKNQESIVKNICVSVEEYLKNAIPEYDLSENPKYQNIKLEELIGFSSISVLMVEQDGYAYYDLFGGCDWDEEHGLNVLMHKSRVVNVGIIDGGSYWKALKDCGKEHVKVEYQKKEPKKYSPHPKYETLKPSLVHENETYELRLIRDKFNDKFIKEVEEGNIDINGRNKLFNESFLQLTCKFRNLELLEYLISKGANISGGIPSCYGQQVFYEGIQLLLQNGASINEQAEDGNTILHKVASELARNFDHYKFFEGNQEKTSELAKEIQKRSALVKKLIKGGADPLIKNAYKFNCFDMGRNLDPKQKAEFELIFTKPKKRFRLW